MFDLLISHLECETKDWPTHKLTCKTLKDAQWEQFKFSTEGPFGQRFHSTTSWHAATNGTQYLDAHATPRNTHGDTPFIIKLQANGSPILMVYDRTKSLNVSIRMGDQNVAAWNQLIVAIQTKGVSPGHPLYKLYCWGERTGDFELSLVLDKLPDQNVPW